MANIILAPALARWLPRAMADGGGAVALEVPGATVRDVLDRLFLTHPGLRSYVVDERGVVRQHVAIFVDGESIRRKDGLDQPLAVGAQVHVLQALSGG